MATPVLPAALYSLIRFSAPGATSRGKQTPLSRRDADIQLQHRSSRQFGTILYAAAGGGWSMFPNVAYDG
jgi:hypothetical protein